LFFELQKQCNIMKRSKLFLGATACLLAIAGVAATKTAKFGTFDAFYSLITTGSPTSWCVYYGAQTYTLSNTKTRVPILGGNYTLQTVGASGSTRTIPQNQPCGHLVAVDPS
jgi:hypothetical protein